MVGSVIQKIDRWLLPEGIVELLPQQAQQLEQLRRQLVDTFNAWGYELVMPPLMEYLESLQVGTGNDLDLQTFKLIDQLTGRLMGIRADMTPQVARIDAHILKRDIPTRLCYIGPVLHTRPSGFERSRAPLQVGAELFGHGGIESDVEILRLMIETLKHAGVENIHIDLGHVGIYRELAKEAGLTEDQEVALFEALQRKDKPEIDAYLSEWGIGEPTRQQLSSLVELNGGASVLVEADKLFAKSGAGVRKALNNLIQIAELAERHIGDLPLYFDLAELRGYRYQTGVVFAAFVPGHGQEIARGGRYDAIGESFGRARPATGFSSDLKTLVSLSNTSIPEARGIFAPALDNHGLDAKIAELRVQGERVVSMLPGQNGEASEFGCDRVLQQGNNGWEVVSI